jgi:uncharacterized Fe-S cluster-containing MiaB family protein
MCQEVNVEFELYYPTKMIAELDTLEKIYKAAAFTGNAEAPSRKITDFHYHIFAEEVLKLLSKAEDEYITTEKLDLIKELNKHMFFYLDPILLTGGKTVEHLLINVSRN